MAVICASLVKGLSISRSRATTSRSTCADVEQRLAGERVHAGDELGAASSRDDEVRAVVA